MDELENLKVLEHDVKISEEGESFIIEKRQKIKHPKINIINMIKSQKKQINNINDLLKKEKELTEESIKEAKKRVQMQLEQMRKEKKHLQENVAIWEKNIGEVKLEEENKNQVTKQKEGEVEEQ